MDVSMLMLSLVPACVLCAMLGIGGGVFELLCEYCKPLRDWIDDQVKNMETGRNEE